MSNAFDQRPGAGAAPIARGSRGPARGGPAWDGPPARGASGAARNGIAPRAPQQERTSVNDERHAAAWWPDEREAQHGGRSRDRHEDESPRHEARPRAHGAAPESAQADDPRRDRGERRPADEGRREDRRGFEDREPERASRERGRDEHRADDRYEHDRREGDRREQRASQQPPAAADTGGDGDDEALTIGRGRGNSIVLDDMLVSRQHVKISADHRGLLIEDLDSRNGTFVNGSRIDRSHLQEGDRIGIGASTFEVRDGWLVSI